tara:strand:+ start:2839 stop:3150 length:312 start_codon:yes stop_codon:yes gene_type:complete
MKKVIGGLRYDTETAEKVAQHWDGYQSDHGHVCESLYRTKNGRWFLAGEGGPASRYAKSVDGNGRIGGSGIVPVTPEVAREHLEGWDQSEASEAFEYFDIKDA